MNHGLERTEYTTKEKFKIYIIFFSLFFYGLGSAPISYPIVVLGFFLTLFFNNYRNISYSQLMNFLLLFLFLLYFYFVSNYFFDERGFNDKLLPVYKLFPHIINPCILYYFSQIIPIKNKDSFLKFLFFAFLSPIILNIVSIFYTLYTKGIFKMLIEREVINVVTGIEMVATFSGAILLLGLCYFTFFFFKIGYPYKIFSAIIVILSFLCSALIQTRTPVFFGSIVLTSIFVFRFVFTTPKYKLRYIFVSVFGILGLTVYLAPRINSLIEAASFFFYRFFQVGLSTPRYESWQTSIVGLADYPFGGMKQVFKFNYAHNFWLDIGNYVGFLPILAILIFQVYNSFRIRKIFSKDKDSFIFLFSLLSAFGFAMLMEPILHAFAFYFSFSVFVMGTIKKYSDTI